MGYFDGLTNAAFKTDEAGRRLFFLYGRFGKGRLLATEDDERSMRAKYKGFYKYTFFVVVPAMIAIRLFLHQSLSVQLIVAGALIVPGYAWLEVHARQYPKVDARITFAESYANSAAGHNLWTLIALTLLSAVFVLIGLFIAFKGKPEDYWIGIGCAIFFGVCGAAIGWMARLKVRQKSRQR
ncbi:MAG: hypothetical protein IPK59_07460 [Rhodospirillaceae bacterium]|nr:hypothetical protein [Rhodospirillaceae bacterium]